MESNKTCVITLDNEDCNGPPVPNKMSKINSEDNQNCGIEALKIDPRNKSKLSSGNGPRHATYKKAEKLFSKYPHLKKFKSKQIKKGKDEPQQSCSEEDAENAFNDSRVPNFSAYKKKDVKNQSTAPTDSNLNDNFSDNSLENNDDDARISENSFDRDDVDIELDNVELSAERRDQNNIS